ncbi:DNA polymerase/3'-5' exonuclease PolX [Polystyrenella longa]|uniref:DNA polymerase beta n=1 Tax=Polystyrenella longa TaxID=2528007 RepID=A0A518CHH6_9PLAN|nr:DNA polymerase/3'-5' exonuclease PolX [Polystyrenella longa]QDU78670.1 DNA polymerase/3'-5' exonuclease PolX [Polystyrenella longa]
MRNSEIAAFFNALADLLEIDGANSFRVRAYRNGARTLDSTNADLTRMVEDEDNLTELDGIGKDLAEKIITIIQTGSLPQLLEMQKKIPAGVVEMLRIPGIGPKKVGTFYRDLKIESLEQLKEAAEKGELAKLKGFGKKTEETIIEGIDTLDLTNRRFYLAEAKGYADEIRNDLLKLESVKQAEVAGSCRRRKETVGDLDVLVTASDSAEAMDALAAHALVDKVIARGDTKQRVRLKNGIELDLRVVPEESYGAALVYFTGSKEHNIVLRRRAQERDLKLNEYGLFKEEKLVAGKTEEEVYQKLDLAWVPPELRESRIEFDLAEADKIPELLELEDIKGDLHMHTTASDGKASIAGMAEAAKQQGLKYIAITDHSKRVMMANGLDGKRLLKHWEEIDRVNEETKGIEILKGIECDILEDGTLDLEDEVLKQGDWVIAVLHYGLKQPRAKIMKRLMTAITNPYVHMIGHPTGRLILKRPGADIDMDEFLKACADHGTLLEINAHFSRLDLSEVHAAAAKDLGIPIVINTDAHSPEGYNVRQYGVYQARRAGLTKADVANTRSWAQMKKLMK